MYHWDWSVVFNSATFTAIGHGLEMTVVVSALSLVFGTALGLIVAVLRLSRSKIVRGIVKVYIDFFRTTPPLVQLIWIFYVVPLLFHISLSAETAGIVTLSLNSGAFLGEIFRGGIESIHRGQRDAAYVLGLSRFQSFRAVILPQAMRRALPATANVFISLVKDSSLLSVIAVGEMTYELQQQVAQTFRPFELYTALAVLYFVITYPLSVASSALERRYRVT